MKGTRRSIEETNAGIPVVNGGEVTTMISKLPMVIDRKEAAVAKEK
jgi:hypothetical protein